MTSERVGERQPADTVALRAARARRADLHGVLVALEASLAKPVPGRAEDWCADVHDTLVEVSATFERHIATTEADDGLYAEIMATQPRFAGALERLRGEHTTIREAIAATLVSLRGVRASADEVREEVMGLLARLIRHRQHGADLVYEAYALDIGGDG